MSDAWRRRIRTRGKFRAQIDVYSRVEEHPFFQVVTVRSKPFDDLEDAARVAGAFSRQHRVLAEVWQGRRFICNVNGMSKARRKPFVAPRATIPDLYTLDDEVAMEHDIRTAMACCFGDPTSTVSSFEQDPDFVSEYEDSVLS